MHNLGSIQGQFAPVRLYFVDCSAPFLALKFGLLFLLG